MELTILMPCLNEAETLAKCITKAKNWAENSGLATEILIADNGSTDGSQDIATELGARVLSVPQRGYGSALYYGSQAAQGKWIIMGDSDDSYDFSNLDFFVDKLQQGYELVMGNRFLGGIKPGAMPWKNRYIGNPFLTWIGRLLFNCPAKDFHCGLRGYTKDAFLKMDLRTTGMEFASEMVIKANLLKMPITEVPTTLSPDGRSRPPHLRPWRDGWRHLRFMLLFSPRWLFVIPGGSLFFISLVIFTALLKGPLHIGNIAFDIHTLFYAEAGLILGYLSLVMGGLIRLIGVREGLLPEHNLLEKLRSSPTLELGSFIGLTLVLGGLAWGMAALSTWGNLKFGNLEPGELLRTICLSTSLILTGGITLLSALIMGFLTLPTREQRINQN